MKKGRDPVGPRPKRGGPPALAQSPGRERIPWVRESAHYARVAARLGAGPATPPTPTPPTPPPAVVGVAVGVAGAGRLSRGHLSELSHLCFTSSKLFLSYVASYTLSIVGGVRWSVVKGLLESPNAPNFLKTPTQGSAKTGKWEAGAAIEAEDILTQAEQALVLG